MRRSRVVLVPLAVAVALALAPPTYPHQEPPLLPQTPAAPTPSPSPAPAAPATVPETTPVVLAVPFKPLGASLDFARWKEMNPRERQTFVEAAVLTLSSITVGIRNDLILDGRTPPEALASVVRLVDLNYPRHQPAAYLKEMESIYLTADGQKLLIIDCFLQAFRRVNIK